MIKFEIEVNGNTIEATVPEGWQEVKLKHIIAMDSQWSGEQSDMIGLLSAFTGREYDELSNTKSNLWEPLFQVLSFVLDAPDWKRIKTPTFVTLGDKKVKPNSKVQLHTFGQRAMAMRVISSDMSNFEKMPELLAIYLQPAYDGKFTAERVPDIKKMVLNMNAFEAMPYGLFFFRKLSRMRVYGLIGLKASRRTLKNLQSIQKQVASGLANLQTSLS